MSVTSHYNGVSPVSYLHNESFEPNGVLSLTPEGLGPLSTTASGRLTLSDGQLIAKAGAFLIRKDSDLAQKLLSEHPESVQQSLSVVERSQDENARPLSDRVTNAKQHQPPEQPNIDSPPASQRFKESPLLSYLVSRDRSVQMHVRQHILHFLVTQPDSSATLKQPY